MSPAHPTNIHNINNVDSMEFKSSKQAPGVKGLWASGVALAEGIATNFRASIFADLPVTRKMNNIVRIQQQCRELEHKFNPKPNQEAAPPAPLKLPRAIVFGDEKAGKSSTIERIAQNDIFPRDVEICTRMPTVLKLRPNKEFPTNEPNFYLTIPECRNKDGVYNQELVCSAYSTRDVGEIRSRIKMQMDAVRASGKGCESDQEIIVELHSEGVLHIDLVDLPGLRQVAEEKDENLVEALEECAKKYIGSPETGVILCVLNARNANIQTTASLRLLKGLNKTNPRVTYSSVAVLTNTDMSVDPTWEECGKSSPCYKVEELLYHCDTDGTGDSTERELRSIFKAGFVALVNRSQENKRRKDHTLEDALDHEMKWFLTKSGMTRFGAVSQAEDDDAPADAPALTEQGKRKLGLPALVGKIDKMIRRFMSEAYIPREIEKQQMQAEAKRAELLSLGTKPDLAQICVDDEFLPHPHDGYYEKPERLSARAVIESATEKVNAFLQRHMEELDFTSSVDKADFDKFNNAQSRLERSKLRLQLEEKVFDRICTEDTKDQGSAIACGVMSAVLEGIRSQFDSDKEGDVQLARFKQLAQVFEEEAKKDMEAGLHAFQKEACAKLAIMFASTSGCTNLDAVHGTTTKLHCMICGMLVESVIQSLLCPLLAPESCEVGPRSAFLQRVQAIIDKDVESFGRNEAVETFLESEEHLAKRVALEHCLHDIHEVIKEWKDMIPKEMEEGEGGAAA